MSPLIICYEYLIKRESIFAHCYESIQCCSKVDHSENIFAYELSHNVQIFNASKFISHGSGNIPINVMFMHLRIIPDEIWKFIL